MSNELEQWKLLIMERKAKGQKVDDCCSEHNITKAKYYYWQKRIKRIEGMAGNSADSAHPVTFVKLTSSGSARTTLQVTWQDVSVQFSNSQEALLAAEMIACLRNIC